MLVTKELFDSLQNFNAYYKYIQDLYAEGKTTGENQSVAMLNYTKLSLTRLKRGLKTYKISPKLVEAAKQHPSKNWMLISEAWCGDAGNIIPIIALLAEQVPGVTLKVMLRDQHPSIMKNYLTNGGKSIPIFVLFDANYNELKRWGPRPTPAQNMVMEHKANPTLSYEDFSVALQKWYVADKTETLQQELIALFS